MGSVFRRLLMALGRAPAKKTETAVGPGLVTSLSLTLTDLRHDEAADLVFTLTHRGITSNFANFVNSNDENTLGGTYVIRDSGASTFQGADGVPIPSGTYRPNNNNLFENFNGLMASGDWTLSIRDRRATDAGRLGSWQLAIETDVVTAPVPEPATWLTMIARFGLVGSAMRRRRLRSIIA